MNRDIEQLQEQLQESTSVKLQFELDTANETIELWKDRYDQLAREQLGALKEAQGQLEQVAKERDFFMHGVEESAEVVATLKARIEQLQGQLQEVTANREEIYNNAVSEIRGLQDELDTVKRQKNEMYDHFTQKVNALQEQQITLPTTTPKPPRKRAAK